MNTVLPTHPAGPPAAKRRNALAVAAAGFLIGGLGNVAWSAHTGSLTAVLLLRFTFGLLAGGGYRLLRRSERTVVDRPGKKKLHLTLAAACDAGSVVLLAAAAQRIDTLTFTLVALAGSVVLGALSRRHPSGRPTRWQALAAGGAIVFSALAVIAGGREGSFSLSGVLLALLSAALGVVSYTAGSYAAAEHHPATIVSHMCLWGCGWSLLLVVAGAEIAVTPSAVAAAAFIALLPGGFAKILLYWSLGRVSPYLVSACKAMMLLSAGVGGWLLLDETPTAAQVAFSVAAMLCVVALAGTGRRKLRPDGA
jgi:drug/metabolite transporter (DMT)-like permease